MKFDGPIDMSLQDWTNISVIIGVTFGLGTLIYTAITARQANRAHDFSTYRQVKKDLDTAWQNYLTADDNTDTSSPIDSSFRFAELLNEVESACFLCNNKVVSKSIENSLRTIIIKSLIIIIENETELEIFRSLAKDRFAFSETFKFVRRHDEIYRKLWPVES